MKKSITTLLVAILAFGSISAFALEVTDSATAIKKAATAAIKSGDMSEIKDLLANISITKAAGGKYNISIVAADTTFVTKEDIPKAAVEKPTLSTDPTVNAR